MQPFFRYLSRMILSIGVTICLLILVSITVTITSPPRTSYAKAYASCPASYTYEAGKGCTQTSCPAGVKTVTVDGHPRCTTACSAGTKLVNAHGKAMCTACPAGPVVINKNGSCYICPAGEKIVKIPGGLFRCDRPTNAKKP